MRYEEERIGAREEASERGREGRGEERRGSYFPEGKGVSEGKNEGRKH